jgi:hypothetical protein
MVLGLLTVITQVMDSPGSPNAPEGIAAVSEIVGSKLK